MADDRDYRIEALELKVMELELAQNELDTVVIRQGVEITQLTSALEAALARFNASTSGQQADKQAGQRGLDSELAADEGDQSAIVHELPPHY